MRFTFSGKKLTAKAVRELEADLGLCLPRDYCSFLQRHNGGTPDKAYFRLKKSDVVRNVRFFHVDKFIGKPSPKAEADSISFRRHLYQTLFYGIIPDGFIAIGTDQTDNLILLKAKVIQCNGSIYFKYVGESFESSDSPMENMHFLSKSFTSFLDSLAVCEEEA